MSEEIQNSADMRRNSDTVLDQSSSSPEGRANICNMLQRRSISIQLPSIFEQECLKRRNNPFPTHEVDEQNKTGASGEISHRHNLTESGRETNALAVGTTKDTDERKNHPRTIRNRPFESTANVPYRRNRSKSVDFGQVLSGGKHTLQRVDARTNQTVKFKKRLDELERSFSKSTLKEIEKLRNLHLDNETE